MPTTEKPQLSPDAVKMLNDLAAQKADGVELTPEARANLEKFGNFHLTHTYRAHKNSYALMAAIFFGVAVLAVLHIANDFLAHPDEIEEILYALPIVGGFAAIMAFVALRMWKTYKRL